MTDRTSDRMHAGKPDYTSLELPPPPEDRPYVLVNMVMSIDGSVVIEGNERGLGSAVDQQLMRELRVNADVVMNGAGTLRASGTSSRVATPQHEALRRSRGLPPHPTAAVVSGSGNLPLDRTFFTARDFDAVVYVSENASQERRSALESTGRPVVVLPAEGFIAAVLRHQRRELGARVVLVEGGPTLNGWLFELGAVDEFFVTLGPLFVAANRSLPPVFGRHAPSLEAVTRAELASAYLNEEGSELYLRYRVRDRHHE